jgi:adenine-specific DNA-methyltransferase
LAFNLNLKTRQGDGLAAKRTRATTSTRKKSKTALSKTAPSKTAAPSKRKSKPLPAQNRTESYQHPEASLIARPEAGQQARFKKRKPKVSYRYDSSLAPEMNWDGQNPAREHGEWLIARIEEASKLKDAKRSAQSGCWSGAPISARLSSS